MSNAGITLIKLVALIGGAVAGAILARWSDDWVSSKMKERADYDKMRYEQGLAATSPQSPPSSPLTIRDDAE
jgi:hypothetical protein